MDLTDTALGSNLHERRNNIKSLVLLFADLNMVALQKGDVLGDAYEYLIGQFAMESGKKQESSIHLVKLVKLWHRL